MSRELLITAKIINGSSHIYRIRMVKHVDIYIIIVDIPLSSERTTKFPLFHIVCHVIRCWRRKIYVTLHNVLLICWEVYWCSEKFNCFKKRKFVNDFSWELYQWIEKMRGCSWKWLKVMPIYCIFNLLKGFLS